MWCRFLTFCVLVSLILFVVASCIYGRPSFHLFFHRCCGDDIENDQVIFENFGTNFLKERLIGGDIIEVNNETFFGNGDIGRITDETKEVLSINDSELKKWIADTHIGRSATADTVAEDKIEVEQMYDFIKDKEKEEEDKKDLKVSEQLEKTETDITLSDTTTEDRTEKLIYVAVNMYQKKEDPNKSSKSSYELLKKEAEEVTESDSRIEFLNVHDPEHKEVLTTM